MYGQTLNARSIHEGMPKYSIGRSAPCTIYIIKYMKSISYNGKCPLLIKYHDHFDGNIANDTRYIYFRLPGIVNNKRKKFKTK